MLEGTFEAKQIGYDAAGNVLFTASGQTALSLEYWQSLRLIAGCLGLNFLAALLSAMALIVVGCRRFELFSFSSLFLFALASASLLLPELLLIGQLLSVTVNDLSNS